TIGTVYPSPADNGSPSTPRLSLSRSPGSDPNSCPDWQRNPRSTVPPHVRRLPRPHLERPARLAQHRPRLPRPPHDLLSRADDEHRRAPVGGRVEGVLGVLLPRVLEDVLAHGLEGHFLEKARGDDAVGVDVVAGQGDAAARQLAALEVGAHRRISRTSVTTPVMAAAATMAGLIRRVRPVGLPWRPMKLRLLEDALISRPWSWSSFMPRHIEQPALRHWKPAAWKISCRPSASAARATC